MATTSQRVASLSNSTLDERRALLQRVLWSRHIEKSTRIRDFLVYVCDRAEQYPSADPHEQEIGHRVFGRAAGYDTTADNIVRVTASQARKKLEQFFASDGASEPLVLEIPKGQYTPRFRERAVEVVPVAEPETLQRPATARRAIVILAVCTALFAASTTWLAWKLRNERLAAHSDVDAIPLTHALWSQLLQRSDRTDVVVADSSLSLFQELLDRPMTLAEYLKPETWTNAGSQASNPDLQAFAQRAAQRRFTSLASVTTAYRIAQIAGKDQDRISIVSPRDFNIRQLQHDNAILLGSSRANPWVELIADRLNFRFGFDQKLRFAYFENKAPRPGESKTYMAGPQVSYCQIAFLPNLGGTGNLLAIAGTETEGTEGGGEFVTSERSLAQLRAFTSPDRNGRWPYFEILLKSTRVGGAAPSFLIVGFRSLHP